MDSNVRDGKVICPRCEGLSVVYLCLMHRNHWTHAVELWTCRDCGAQFWMNLHKPDTAAILTDEEFEQEFFSEKHETDV